MEYAGTPEDVYNLLTNAISKSRYTSVEFIGAPQVTIIKFRTKLRYSLHDSLQEYLNNSSLKSYYDLVKTSDQTNLKVFYINHKDGIRTKILVKPRSGREWMQSGFWNETLESLPNWNDLKNTPDNQVEYEILKDFNEKIASLGEDKPVHVTIGSDEYRNIVGMVSGPSGQKADFMGIDKDGKIKFFISHKDGFNSTDFQQYSGISSRAGDAIYNHPEVQEFRKEISKKTTEDFYGKMYYREIKNLELKQRAVFGKDFSDGPADQSFNNISYFAQGRLALLVRQTPNKKQRAKLSIDFGTKLVNRGDMDMLMNDYVPFLGARQGEVYRTIQYETDDGGSRVNGVRGGVFAKGYIEGRNSEPI
jgi:hypothetical protein